MQLRLDYEGIHYQKPIEIVKCIPLAVSSYEKEYVPFDIMIIFDIEECFDVTKYTHLTRKCFCHYLRLFQILVQTIDN